MVPKPSWAVAVVEISKSMSRAIALFIVLKEGFWQALRSKGFVIVPRRGDGFMSQTFGSDEKPIWAGRAVNRFRDYWPKTGGADVKCAVALVTNHWLAR